MTIYDAKKLIEEFFDLLGGAKLAVNSTTPCVNSCANTSREALNDFPFQLPIYI